MARPRPTTPARATAAAAAVIASAVLGGSVWWFASGGPARQGYAKGTPSRCPATSSSITFVAPARDGLDVRMLPVPYPEAPKAATVCRYAPGGALTDVVVLDPPRTTTLAAAVARPVGGWPSDGLAAKRIPEVTAEQRAAQAPPACGPRGSAGGDDGAAWFVRFAYNKGRAVAVRVRPGPCADTSNGALTLRTTPDLLEALSRIPL